MDDSYPKGTQVSFNYDWWFGGAHRDQVEEAKGRCAISHFPNVPVEEMESNAEVQQFMQKLEARTVLYLRDGFSYEMKEVIQRPNTTMMTFECMPSDEAYRVGCFVVSIPYDDIVRVEVFAVHPEEKPDDMPAIKGFGGQPPPGKVRPDERPRREDMVKEA